MQAHACVMTSIPVFLRVKKCLDLTVNSGHTQPADRTQKNAHEELRQNLPEHIQLADRTLKNAHEELRQNLLYYFENNQILIYHSQLSTFLTDFL